jgi:DNA primase
MWQGKCIGYTARAMEDGIKPKYYTHHEPDFVFNMDLQTPDKQFVIVTEGPFDAMSVDGVAVLGSEVSDQQADIIDSLKREVIVVPDFDIHVDEKSGKKKWPGRSLIDAALDNNWSVSFPVWTEKYKDVSEATENFGKLFALKSIIDAKETSALKIELLTKKLYNTL